ncbi:sugar transferase [Wenxinia saemankumensis]|uniref:Sugar transferase involved in LPS biosynthesis (Colanic, teichoic acid) n=1 Tax=Wenxinia saemankumensis TaxID=1447782 RepID=A0A1M6FZZ5_9RHOB|nr:sugar transferase [Wenxinia saemankumensis]SHJ03298.1 Sugar transferase involved in LPS biosynthesis (colanic, teichoic acid) [Wenxinia saemankumensis]
MSTIPRYGRIAAIRAVAAEAAAPARVDGVRAEGPGRTFYRDRAKRWIDIALVLAAALPVLMVVLPLALLVARDGANPFFGQARVGLDGRTFRMWKLRSMVVDAEAALERHLAADPAARAEWDLQQKLRRDPRVTPIGRIIRRTSLDELPQLWNVLRGDMSLVGPRPMMVSQRAIYPGKEYYTVRPGLTGLWQISERNETSFHERAVFDRAYCETLSLGADARILSRTLGVVVRGTGY